MDDDICLDSYDGDDLEALGQREAFEDSHGEMDDEGDSEEVALEEADYMLPEGQESVWIRVDSISVYIRRCDEGVEVSLYPNGDAMGECLAETRVPFPEA